MALTLEAKIGLALQRSDEAMIAVLQMETVDAVVSRETFSRRRIDLAMTMGERVLDVRQVPIDARALAARVDTLESVAARPLAPVQPVDLAPIQARIVALEAQAPRPTGRLGN